MSIEKSIEIKVDTAYVSEQSDPEQQRYVFSYTVNIHNHGSETVKLLSRHWLIVDGNEKVQEVRGQGVVGKQPSIAPGECYEYTSGAILETTMGTMEGSYQMTTESTQKTFDAAIGMFSLLHPGSLH